MKKSKLMSCPFCGGEASIYHGDSTDGYIKNTDYVLAFCGWCGASIRGNKEDEVIKKWNTRSNPWHTGKPTEDGEYLVICYFVIDHYYYRRKLVWDFENGDWKDIQRFTESNYFKEFKILAWYGQKIKPYEEK